MITIAHRIEHPLTETGPLHAFHNPTIQKLAQQYNIQLSCETHAIRSHLAQHHHLLPDVDFDDTPHHQYLYACPTLNTLLEWFQPQTLLTLHLLDFKIATYVCPTQYTQLGHSQKQLVLLPQFSQKIYHPISPTFPVDNYTKPL